MNPRYFILPALLALALGWFVLGYRPTDPPVAAPDTIVSRYFASGPVPATASQALFQRSAGSWMVSLTSWLAKL